MPPVLRGRQAARHRRHVPPGRRGGNRRSPAPRAAVRDQARHDRERAAGNRGASGLSRRQPRLSGAGAGRHAAAGGRSRGGEHRARLPGLAPFAAGSLPHPGGIAAVAPGISPTLNPGYIFRPGAKRRFRKRGMTRLKIPRREALLGSGAVAASSLLASVSSAAPPASAVTPQLVDAAKKEGKIVYYTSIDLPVAERIAKAFEATYPGIAVRVERTGAERVFQRIGQEYASRIHAVDVVNSSDAAHFIVWKREGILEPYLPEDVAKYYPAEHKDPDGQFASFRVGLSVIGYNTNLVKAEEAPKSFADLLDPKWSGKMVKAHPGYSGTIMTATYQMSRDLGWEFFEKLAKQRIMQVQSSSDPPKKLALGERAIMADGVEYVVFQQKEGGKPVEPVYAIEGTPLIIGPN